MRFFINVIRVVVGVLFIISGLVKANDPLGLSYKMQEFFEVWTADLSSGQFFLNNLLIGLLHFLNNHSLALSVVMITLEIVAGVALLVGWQRKAVLRLLLLLIIFFTFLTAYAYWSGKFKNCGCFGDCLPISPLTSLVKDVALLVLILILIAQQKWVQPWRAIKAQKIAVIASLILSLALQWYVLQYLPFADCLPFKKGNNIPQQMQMPASARPDSFAIVFVYEKGGKSFEFAADALPADLGSYKYIDRRDKLIRKGNAEPPIKGFALTGTSGTDSTAAVLAQPQAYILFIENFKRGTDNWIEDFKKFALAAKQKGVPVYAATAAPMQEATALFIKNGLANVPLFALDFTAIRTAARTAPTLYFLKSGTVQEKYSYRQIDNATEGLQP